MTTDHVPLNLTPTNATWLWGNRALVYIDGCCKGNPGPCGIGATFLDVSLIERHTISENIGVDTNNVAEWKALCHALWEAVLMGVLYLEVYTDSALVKHQFEDRWRCNDELLRTLRMIALYLARQLHGVEVHQVPREENRRADQLANLGVKKIRC